MFKKLRKKVWSKVRTPVIAVGAPIVLAASVFSIWSYFQILKEFYSAPSTVMIAMKNPLAPETEIKITSISFSPSDFSAERVKDARQLARNGRTVYLSGTGSWREVYLWTVEDTFLYASLKPPKPQQKGEWKVQGVHQSADRRFLEVEFRKDYGKIIQNSILLGIATLFIILIAALKWLELFIKFLRYLFARRRHPAAL